MTDEWKYAGHLEFIITLLKKAQIPYEIANIKGADGEIVGAAIIFEGIQWNEKKSMETMLDEVTKTNSGKSDLQKP